MIALIRECSFDAQEAINAVRYESAIKMSAHDAKRTSVLIST